MDEWSRVVDHMIHIIWGITCDQYIDTTAMTLRIRTGKCSFFKTRQRQFNILVNSSFLDFEVDEVLMYQVMPSHLKIILNFYAFCKNDNYENQYLVTELTNCLESKWFHSASYNHSIREFGFVISLSEIYFPLSKSFGYYGYMLMINTQGHIFT